MNTEPFVKTLQIMRLAEMASARPEGICLTQIAEAFEVNARTSQRMTRALEMIFPTVRTYTDRHRRKWWQLGDSRILHMQGIRDSELAALEMGIRRAEREGATTDASALNSLRDRLLAIMPTPFARRAEVDAEAVLEALGHACRPGPRVLYSQQLLMTVNAALKGPHELRMTYAGAQDTEPRQRVVEPYGVLFGMRGYLIAREIGTGSQFRQFRLDRISQAVTLPGSFARDASFDLRTHASRAFGSYHSDAEYGPVEWKFAPAAAAVARGFVFHPDQEVETNPEGSLTVRFTASGWLEMAWHLYQWGDTVEVITPVHLRDMVAGFRRGDFPALP